jgi:hypothetical protein
VLLKTAHGFALETARVNTIQAGATGGEAAVALAIWNAVEVCS